MTLRRDLWQQMPELLQMIGQRSGVQARGGCRWDSEDAACGGKRRKATEELTTLHLGAPLLMETVCNQQEILAWNMKKINSFPGGGGVCSNLRVRS
jgi:hypothetical protein